MRMSEKIVAAGIAALVSGPAAAGGMGSAVPEPVLMTPAAPAQTVGNWTGGDWTGGYVGGQLSYGNASAGAPDGNGALYGLRAGYDYDFGKLVLGGSVEYDKSDIGLSGNAGSLDSVTRLKIRAGADLGRTLVYATAGPAHADATIAGVGRSDNGYFGGVGAEYRMTDQWSVGGEILSHRFNNFDGTGTDVKATTAGVNVSFRF